MAIQRHLTKVVYGQTITLTNTYNQVTHVALNKNRVDCVLTVYTDATKTEVVQKDAFTFVPNVYPNAQEILTQCYENIKTNEGFENAVDI